MSIPALSRLADGIHHLQGDYLDTWPPIYALDPSLSAALGLVRIAGISLAGNAIARGASIEAMHREFLRGVYGAFLPWGFVVLGEPGNVSVCLALTGGVNAVHGWRNALRAAFQECEVSEGPAADTFMNAAGSFGYAAAVTGNPSVSPATGNTPGFSSGLEPLFRTMADTHWAYFVFAKPVSGETVQQMLDTTSREEREVVSAFMRPGTSEADNNPLAQRYLDLLRCTAKKCEAGQREGMWQTWTYLLTNTPLDLARGSQALSGILAGPDSLPQPLRVRPCRRPSGSTEEPGVSTLLTTAELARLSLLPSEEFPGYMVHKRAAFSVSPPAHEEGRVVAIGTIMAGGHRSHNWFAVNVDDLSKHVFVAGVSGSGKTSTCQYLLSQLWCEHHIPWLVIEPSGKAEYRRLAASSLGDDLQVYTLGDETCAPLRLNPLEILPGMPVQTHIESLSSLFTASFSLVPPMPDVLNQALHQLYIEFGWDLLRGTNPRGNVPEVQPSLSDLIRTLERMIPALGYDSEITGNLRAGLTTRLRNLTVGGKGAMLDSGIPAAVNRLLERPTVLELGAIGDDDCTALIIASALLHLSEFRRISGLSGGCLRHVILLEEAHRLLRATPESLVTDYANPRGKAVEAFCQMLTEMRAYGEGIFIVDQVPAKLAPDAVKNTNLKIIHRLVAGDDRDLVGATMNLSASQRQHLATLSRGAAVVYAEGRDASFLVQVPDHAGRHGYGNAEVSNGQIRQRMQNAIVPLPKRAENERTAGTLPVCRGCDIGNCPHYRHIAQWLLGHDYSCKFARAVEEGPEAIWTLGRRIATDAGLTAGGLDMPYCIILALLSLAGYGQDILDHMKQQIKSFKSEQRRQKP